MTIVDHLNQLAVESRQRETKKLEIILDESKKPFHILSFIGINEILFLQTAFLEKDFQRSKIYLYKVAMTNSYYHEKLNGEIFEAIKIFTYPLLCDNTQVINRYLRYDKTQYNDSFSTYFGKAIQSALKSDNRILQANIDGLKKRSKKGWAKQYIGIVTVFEGFLYSDKSTIEKGLQSIIDMHDQQEQPPLVKDYINFEATALAKLAWRKGIEVEVQSNLIPKELLPVRELANYETYPFFQELTE